MRTVDSEIHVRLMRQWSSVVEVHTLSASACSLCAFATDDHILVHIFTTDNHFLIAMRCLMTSTQITYLGDMILYGHAEWIRTRLLTRWIVDSHL